MMWPLMSLALSFTPYLLVGERQATFSLSANADHVRGMKNATEESGVRPARKDVPEEGYCALRGRAIG